MSKKELFIKEIEEKISLDKNFLSKDAIEYFETLKTQKGNMTENGKIILKYMQENNGEATIFTAKTIGTGINMPARSVSGSIRKLVNENYVKKIATSPITYSLTELGQEYQFDN